LARFKDTYRQATIDLMLGNNVSAESLNALGGQQGNDDTDAMENAEHARLLVDDCRRMLLGTTLVIGAWGLIDADPTTGDLNETEVDSIVLLTSAEFFVADYDSHLDKIVKFECVPLNSITLVEFGLFQQQQIFKSPAPAHLCIRINYMIDNVDGYFHMFRSPNIRFFNNTAVVIKKSEELVESMTAIVEFFRIALESIGRSDIPVICGGTLQRRKSRSLLQPPGIPRNLSESQLVQIGSKALSNVAGQFSKLGQSLNPAKGKNNKQNANPPMVYQESKSSNFYVGREAKEDDDSDDDNECSIYEPELVETEQNPIFNENAFLPSVGIVMSNPQNDESSPEMLANKDTAKNPSDMSTISISSVTNHIHVPSGMISPLMSPMKLNAPEITLNSGPAPRREEMTLNLSGSQSENAIRQLKSLTSPLSMIAKGVQSLGLASKVKYLKKLQLYFDLRHFHGF
jgi:phosphatidylinositol 4-phosphatase